MFYPKLILAALVSCAFYLSVIQIALNALERKLIHKGLWNGEIKDLAESPPRVISITQLIIDIAFYAATPLMVYGVLYLLIPFEGARAGIAIALGCVAVGSTPLLMTISLRAKFPVPALFFLALSQLLKLGGSLALIGVLFSL